MSLVGKLENLIAGSETGASGPPGWDVSLRPAADPPEPTPTTAPAARTAGLKTEVDEAAAARESIRSLLQKTGAAFGAGATLVLAGLGYTQVHQIFPLPPGRGYLIWFALAAGLAALGGGAWVTARFFGAQRRILLSTGGGVHHRWWKKIRHPSLLFTSGPIDLRWRDRHIRRDTFHEHAQEQGKSSMEEVENYGLMKWREAENAPECERATLIEQAKFYDAFVEAVLSRTATKILERRAAAAFHGLFTILALAITVTGIVVLFGLADYSKGQRDLIDLRTKCSEAVGKGATDACDSIRSSAAQKAAKDEAAKEQEALTDATHTAGKGAPVVAKWGACGRLVGADQGLSAVTSALKTRIVKACFAGG